jgi:hypothetical protein
MADLAQIRLEDSELGGALEIAVVSPRPEGSTLGVSTFSAAPHRTVSQSEAGFEKVMQAACITMGQTAGNELRITLRVTAKS